MPQKRDYIDEIKKAGAFVLPPKLVAVVEEPVETIEVEPVAEIGPKEPYKLVPRSEPVEIQKESPVAQDSEPTPTDALAATPDDTLDFVCVHWDEKRGSGVARFPNERKHTTNGFRIKQKSILTEGMMKPGAMICGKLIQAKDSGTDFEVTEIQIYRD